LVGTSFKAGFTASALQPADPGLTSISGLVLDNQDNPLANVTVRVDGSNRQAVTNAQGQFKITQSPVGPVHLIVDGSTTTARGEWPTLSYNIVTIAGADNPLSAPVYMVKLDTDRAVYVGKEDKELTLPEVPGFKLKVKAGSVTFPDGSKEGYLSVTPVNANKVPMAPPNGMQPQFIVTIQPTGAKFDPPAPLTLPNVDGHKPGAQVEMYSYDHDLEEFVSIGLGTVTADGSLIESNPGVGVIKAGWHCGSQPGGSGCVNSCAICKDCDGDCNCVPKDSDSRLASLDIKGDCRTPVCDGGKVKQEIDITDTPDAVCWYCNVGAGLVGGPDGKECKEGQPCWKCEGSSCKRELCEPSNYVEHSVYTAENTLGTWQTKVLKGLKYLPIPLAELTVASQVVGTIKKGEECCEDCNKPTKPQKYTEYAGGARLNIQSFLGKDIAKKREITFFKTYRIAIDFNIRVGANIVLAPNATVTGKINTVCEEACVTASGGAKLGVVPSGSVKVGGWAAKKVGGEWVDSIGGAGSGEAALRTTGAVKASIAIGHTCTKADLCSYNFGDGVAYYQWKIEFNIPFLFDYEKFTRTGRDEFIIWEGFNGSCL
jgi:hypothetical protein